MAQFGIDHLIKHYEIQHPILIDDSGLFINALNGFPGVYSAYALKTISYQGILKLMSGIQDRKAYFEASLAYKEPGREILFAHGRCDGEISHEPMLGPQGFGFDPVFVPYVDLGKLADRSFSQMELVEKNVISHRGKAVTDLINKLARSV